MSSSAPNTPSVLAVLVVRDAAPWLRRSLAALSRQTHPRLGVLAVDAGSRDASVDILERSLGKRRVIRAGAGVGFPGAVRRALAVPAAREADYTLLIHDDVALAPDAVERMLEAAAHFERAGIVGAKVVDWERPEVLREVGFACDRFGHPFSPLEEDEIDHGQYDAPREVMFVSAAAMLVAKDVWTRAGVPDERLKPAHGDLDLCWRARVAGYRVVVTPDAIAYHRMAGARGERVGAEPGASRYFDERAGLASALKAYRVITLAWLLPLYLAVSTGRIAGSIVSRHLEDAGAILRAWGWNLVQVPGTIRRRARAQAVRSVRDHEIGRFMTAPGTRLRRLALQASALVARRGAPSLDEEIAEPDPFRRRAAAYVSDHPAAVALVAALFLVLLGFRDVLFVPEIQGGALPVFPERASAFFAEFTSPWRSTGFGGTGGASPALFVLGLGSTLTFGDPGLLARLFIAFGPLLAGISCYRATRRVTGERRGATLGAVSYALSGLVLWAAADGRVWVLVLLVAFPWLVVRLGFLFDGRQGRSPLRWIVGTAAVLALVGSFFPAVWLSVFIATLPIALTARAARARGAGLTLAAFAAAAVLVFPFTLELALAGGGSSVEAAGTVDLWHLLRLVPSASIGTWLPALFLPIAGLLGFAIAQDDDGWSGRSLATAVPAVALAWLAATGRLPEPLANPVAFLAAAAFPLSLLVALGFRSAASAVRRAAFGSAQLVAVALSLVVGAGIILQAGHLVFGRIEVGEHREPPAWPVVSRAAARTSFRVLWLGPADGERLPAPGGQPTGLVEDGPRSVAYAVTGKRGRSALALGLPAGGGGDAAVEEALASMISGEVRHGGSLLGTAGIRFIVAGQGALPPRMESVLDAQVDVDLVQTAGGLTIWRNEAALPIASVAVGADALEAARGEDSVGVAALDRARVEELERAGDGWSGTVGGEPSGVALVSTEFDPGWRLDDGSDRAPFRAFGWQVGFPLDGSVQGQIAVGFDAGPGRTVELIAMGLLWAGVVWVVGRRPRAPARHVRTEPVEAPITRPVREPGAEARRAARVPGDR